MTSPRLHFFSAQTLEAENALKDLVALYGQTPLEQAEVVVALGGDGTMLAGLHDMATTSIPVYGMNLGSVGFLMNPHHTDNLPSRIQRAHHVTIHPLSMSATDTSGVLHQAFAFNEVSLLRQVRQAAKISISIDGVERLDELICDGVLVSTAAGSTAYNLSAHGPIIPLGSSLLALTPISAFRPRRWRGALLPSHVAIGFKILEAQKRPVSATADDVEIRDVVSVEIRQAETGSKTILFDPDHSLEERILKEQFAP